jgi:hypothetical protein
MQAMMKMQKIIEYQSELVDTDLQIGAVAFIHRFDLNLKKFST